MSEDVKRYQKMLRMSENARYCTEYQNKKCQKFNDIAHNAITQGKNEIARITRNRKKRRKKKEWDKMSKKKKEILRSPPHKQYIINYSFYIYIYKLKTQFNTN
jgi:hypothetical protein